MTGLVFNVQRFSIHDGPGIRTTVFMKGCNLHCFWCHNPESLKGICETQYYFEKCIGCRACESVCTNGAHMFDGSRHIFDRSRCAACGECAAVCDSEALIFCGKEYSWDKIFSEIKRDVPFYTDGGGVTFSGGEPLLQSGFVAAAARLCVDSGINVAVDTAGNVPWKAFEDVLPYTETFLYDIKHCDALLYKTHTGADMAKVICNLERLLERKTDVWVRVPFIPNFNADRETVCKIAETVASVQEKMGHKIQKFELMPFHKTAAGKYESLGLKYAAEDFEAPGRDAVRVIQKEAENILGL